MVVHMAHMELMGELIVLMDNMQEFVQHLDILRQL
jgi:hypothetical protein